MADLLLLGFIAGYVRGGWSTGFLRRLVGLGYLALALVVGAYLREPVGALVVRLFPQVPPQYADMVGYSIAFAVLVAALNIVTGPVLSRWPSAASRAARTRCSARSSAASRRSSSYRPRS